MTKVAIVGIDALDSRILRDLRPNLPNFDRLMGFTGDLRFDGVFPPDSPTSWASIYTGLTPANHGIVLFVDPLAKVSDMVTKDIDDSSIRGRTFWDIAGRNGKQVCILPHLLGFPVWEINGAMIGRSGVTREVQCYPSGLRAEHDIAQFRWDLDLFPGRHIKRFLNAARSQIRREVAFALRLMQNLDWDLYFVSFGELDVIQYSFWSHHDPADPLYNERSKFRSVIKDFYVLFDGVIGTFLNAIRSDVTLMVVSDHGMGSRPVRLFNVNSFLQSKSLLLRRSTTESSPRPFRVAGAAIQLAKHPLFWLIGRFQLGNAATLLLRSFPDAKEILIGQQTIDYGASAAYLVDQSGIKVYPYGGVVINEGNIDPARFDDIRNLVIRELAAMRDPVSGESVFNWIRKREDLHSGPYLSRYPSVVFEMNTRFGAGNEVPSPLFGVTQLHSIVPGCHRQHHATFLWSAPRPLSPTRMDMSLMDVAPTVLDLLGVESRAAFDGRSILE